MTSRWLVYKALRLLLRLRRRLLIWLLVQWWYCPPGLSLLMVIRCIMEFQRWKFSSSLPTGKLFSLIWLILPTRPLISLATLTSTNSSSVPFSFGNSTAPPLNCTTPSPTNASPPAPINPAPIPPPNTANPATTHVPLAPVQESISAPAATTPPSINSVNAKMVYLSANASVNHCTTRPPASKQYAKSAPTPYKTATSAHPPPSAHNASPDTLTTPSPTNAAAQTQPSSSQKATVSTIQAVPTSKHQPTYPSSARHATLISSLPSSKAITHASAWMALSSICLPSRVLMIAAMVLCILMNAMMAITMMMMGALPCVKLRRGTCALRRFSHQSACAKSSFNSRINTVSGTSLPTLPLFLSSSPHRSQSSIKSTWPKALRSHSPVKSPLTLTTTKLENCRWQQHSPKHCKVAIMPLPWTSVAQGSGLNRCRLISQSRVWTLGWLKMNSPTVTSSSFTVWQWSAAWHGSWASLQQSSDLRTWLWNSSCPSKRYTSCWPRSARTHQVYGPYILWIS